MKPPKNLQVRMSPSMHRKITLMAYDETITVTELVKKALETYAVLAKINHSGKRLASLNALGEVEMEIIIPGVTVTMDDRLSND